MHDRRPTRNAPALTRRRMLLGGAAAGSVLVLRGLPALGQEGEPGPTTTEPGPTSTSTTTTSPTTTAPATTVPPTTTTAPPATTAPDSPLHDEDDVVPTGDSRAFGTLLSESPDRGIMFPMLGRPNSSATWTDTYGACRSGCSRRHQGQDLIAPQMTKMLACVSGTIVELRHRSSGNSLYIQGDDGWFYCYLHINDERPGTHSRDNRVDTAWGPKLHRFATGTHSMNETAARGFRVERGDFVAFNGDSGNAEGTYHLHFEIRKPAPGSYSSETSRLWNSASVNPRVSLQNAAPAVEGGVPPETFTPWDNAGDLIRRQYSDLLGRTAGSDNIGYWGGKLNSGDTAPAAMMAFFLESDEADSKAHSIARLYRAYFLRNPEYAGFAYWVDKRRRGMSVSKVSENFERVPEFTSRYGSLSNGAFVDLVYRNVLDREAEPAGRTYWMGELDRGLTRGKLMAHFSESAEYTAANRRVDHVLMMFALMLKRMPTDTELFAFVSHLNQGGSVEDLMHLIRIGDEYRGVVGL